MTCRSLVLVVLAACSGDHYHGVDAPPRDVASDSITSSMGNPTATAVALTITSLGQPVANTTVYFQTADSTLVSALVTDARGLAWAEVGDGGYVTALEAPGQTGPTLTTFSAVHQGDRLHLDLDPVVAFAQATFTITVPAKSGAVSYVIRNACGGEPVAVGPGATGEVTVPNCGGGVNDFVVQPVDSDGNFTLGMLYATNVALAPTVTLPGGYAPADATTLDYTGVPTTVTFVEAYRAIVTPRGRLFDQTVATPPNLGTASFVVGEPHATGATALTATTGMPAANMRSEQTVYDWSAWGAPYALDVGAHYLPDYAGPAAFDVGTQAIRWTEQGGAVGANVVRAEIHISRETPPDTRAWTWHVVAPRGSEAALPLPKLPVVDFDFNANATDTVGVGELTNALVPGGYATVREHGFAPLLDVVTGGHLVVETQYEPAL